MPTVDEVIATLTPKIQNAVGVEQSATVLINGIPAMIQAAVDKANQAQTLTPAQAQAFADLQDSVDAATAPLAAAVAANPA